MMMGSNTFYIFFTISDSKRSKSFFSRESMNLYSEKERKKKVCFQNKNYIKKMTTETKKSETKIVQAAGHGLLRLDPDRPGAIVKPTTRQECVTYECMTHDTSIKNFLQFLPQYFSSWPMEKIVAGSKFTHEVSLGNLCRLSEAEEDPATSSILKWKGLLTCKRSKPTKNKDDQDDETERIETTIQQLPANGDEQEQKFETRIVHEGAPSVLDLKIGRFRHTNSTPLRKYMRMWRKDGPTTSRSVGMRICGVKHSRFVTNSFFDFDDEEEEDQIQNTNCEEGATKKESRREKRLASIKNRKEKAIKAGESDSEIMQLPRAAEQARKNKEVLNDPNQQSKSSDILLETLNWTEDKVLGRNATAEELLEVLAMFCTIFVDRKSAIGRSPVCPEDKSASQRFDPLPDVHLLEYFLSRMNEMMRVLDEEKILEKYSFASASILYLYRFVVKEVVVQKEKTPTSTKKFILELEADLRLVDFSSSGPILEELKYLGTAYNPKLRTDETNEKTSRDDEMVNPFATHQPQKEMVKPFADEAIEFKFGLENVKASLEHLITACQIMKKRMTPK
jgi:hypothetical protein